MNHAPSKSSPGHANGVLNNTLLNGSNGVNGSLPKTNGDLNGNSVLIDTLAIASPAVDSPTTPISNLAIPDVKISIDFQEQESDARHEPMPVKLDVLDNASTMPQVGTPMDPSKFSFLLFFVPC